MLYWVKLLGLYLLSGLVYAIVTWLITFIHYGRIFGFLRVCEVVSEGLIEKDELSIVWGLINLLLWPYQITANAIELSSRLEKKLTET